MNYENVKELLKAGFTAEEIRKMLPVESEEEKAAESSGKPLSDGKASESDEEARPAEASKPEDYGEIKSWIKGIEQSIASQIAEVKALQQAMNVKVFDTEGGDDEEKPLSTIDVYTKLYSKPAPTYGVEEGEKE